MMESSSQPRLLTKFVPHAFVENIVQLMHLEHLFQPGLLAKLVLQKGNCFMADLSFQSGLLAKLVLQKGNCSTVDVFSTRASGKTCSAEGKLFHDGFFL